MSYVLDWYGCANLRKLQYIQGILAFKNAPFFARFLLERGAHLLPIQPSHTLPWHKLNLPQIWYPFNFYSLLDWNPKGMFFQTMKWNWGGTSSNNWKFHMCYDWLVLPYEWSEVLNALRRPLYRWNFILKKETENIFGWWETREDPDLLYLRSPKHAMALFQYPAWSWILWSRQVNLE